MSKNKEILIIGAGPSGLSAAIFLHEQGFHPVVIDKKESISPYSKALAINPRTLEIYQDLGLTERFLNNGRIMKAINLWKGDKHLYKNNFSKSNHKYPFMLVQPQKESEEILLEEVRRRKIDCTYGSAFTSFEEKDGQYTVQADTINVDQKFDYLIGADGGRSMVREQSSLSLSGFSYDESWEIYDVELEMDMEPNEGHIRIFPEGGMIMIRLKDSIWRLAGNLPSILNYLPKGTNVGDIHWESKFRIHHKVANGLVDDGIAIIGDAAHLHSPVAARGMNLGIEDAFLVSKLIANDDLSSYNKQRKKYLESTVSRINTITIGLAGDTFRSRMVRNNIQNLKFMFPIIMPHVRKFILGIN